MGFAEMMHARAAGDVGVEHHQLGKFIAQRGQGLAEGFAQGIAVGDQGGIRHAETRFISCALAPSAVNASSLWARVSFTLPCQAGMFSI